MKIMLASESYYPNVDGGAVAEHNLARGLAKLGHQVYIIAPGNRWEDYTDMDEGTTIFRQKACTMFFLPNYKATIWPYKNISKIMNEIKPDILHLHNPYPIGTCSMLVAKKLKIPVVGSNHLLPENLFMFISKLRFMYNIFRDLGWKALVKFYNKCNYVISPTQTAINLLLDHGLKTQSGPMSNGINLSVFKPGVADSEFKKKYNIPEKPVVLYTGRLSGEKCLEVLMNAVPLVLKKIDACFVFAGEGGELNTLKSLAESLGVSKNVVFIGFMSKGDFPILYRAADLFAIPSIAELQSIVTMEAMATGLPAVAANKYALPELVHNGENGYLFEPGNSPELADKICKILSDKQLKEKMGKESLEIIKIHELDNVVRQFEAIYLKFVKR
ncbi:MAG: glycosyltransferase [Candidatus Firestonebacteria bacterium]